MNVQKMHIAVMEGLDRASSFYNDDFLSGQIDSALNQAVTRMLEKTYSNRKNPHLEGFDRTDEQDIKLSNIVVPISLDILPSSVYPNQGEVPLPPDFLFPVSAQASIKYSCDGVGFTATSGGGRFIAEIDLNTPATSPYWDNLKIVLDDGSTTTTLFDASLTDDLGAWAAANTDGYQYWDTIELAMDRINMHHKDRILVYKDFYDSSYKNNTLFFIDTTGNATASWQITVTYTTGSLSSFFSKTTKNKYDTTGATLYTKPLTTINDKYIHLYIFNPYRSATYEFPLATITNGNFITYYDDKKFIIDSIKLSYVMTPIKINLSLKQNCILHESIHQNIVDEAIDILLEQVMDPRTQTHGSRSIEIN